MATLCNFGQIPDIRFRTLCCKGQIVVDSDCSLIANNSFIQTSIATGPGSQIILNGASVDFRDTTIDFSNTNVCNLDTDIMGDVFVGKISGTIFQDNFTNDFVGDIFGNLNGDIVGNINGDILGNLTSETFASQTILADSINVKNQLTTNILVVKGNLISKMCVAPNESLIFKPGSELRGNICIPDGSFITFKNTASVTIETAFGTFADGDLLYQGSDGITTNLSLGPDNSVLMSNGNTVIYGDDLCLDSLKANGLVALNVVTADISLVNPTFNNVITNTLITEVQLEVDGEITSEKTTADLCGNFTGTVGSTIVTGNLCLNKDVTFKDSVSLFANIILPNQPLTLQTANTTFDQSTGNLTITNGANVTINENLVVCGNIGADRIQTKTMPTSIVFDTTTLTTDNFETLNTTNLSNVTLFGPLNFSPSSINISQSVGELTVSGGNIVVEKDAVVCGNVLTNNITNKNTGQVVICGNLVTQSVIGGNAATVLSAASAMNVADAANGIVTICPDANLTGNLIIPRIVQTDSFRPRFRNFCQSYFIEASIVSGFFKFDNLFRTPTNYLITNTDRTNGLGVGAFALISPGIFIPSASARANGLYKAQATLTMPTDVGHPSGDSKVIVEAIIMFQDFTNTFVSQPTPRLISFTQEANPTSGNVFSQLTARISTIIDMRNLPNPGDLKACIFVRDVQSSPAGFRIFSVAGMSMHRIA